MSKKIIKLTEKDLEGIIEKVISEQPTPSQQIVAGVRKESAKVNTDYYKAVGKKMDTFQKSNNKSDTIESKDLKKVNADQGMGEEKKDVIQDYNYALQNLRYDTQPSKAYKERQEMAIKGDPKMGNGETEATEMTEDLKDPKLGEKIIDAAKARYKAETESPYNKTVSMGDDIETTKESPNKERQLAFENIVSDIKEKLLAEGIELSDEDIAVSLKEEIAGYGFGFKKEAEEVTKQLMEEESINEIAEVVYDDDKFLVISKEEDEDESEEEDTVEEGSRTLGNGKSHGRKGLSKPRSAPSHIAVDESFDRMKELMGIKSSKPIIKEEVSNDMPCPICHGFPCECKEEEAEGTLAVSLKEDIAGLGYGFKQENDSTIEEETMEAILSEEACPDCGKEVCECSMMEETTEEVSEEEKVEESVENKKYKRLKYSTEFESTDQALTLIPEHHKVDGNMFQLTDNNNYITVRWEGNKENGEGVVLLHKNNKLMNEQMDRMKYLFGHSMGKEQTKTGVIKEETAFKNILKDTRDLKKKSLVSEQEKRYSIPTPEDRVIFTGEGQKPFVDFVKVFRSSIGYNENETTVGEYAEQIVAAYNSIDGPQGMNHPIVVKVRESNSEESIIDLQHQITGNTDFRKFINLKGHKKDFVDGTFGPATAKALLIWIGKDTLQRNETNDEVRTTSPMKHLYMHKDAGEIYNQPNYVKSAETMPMDQKMVALRQLIDKVS